MRVMRAQAGAAARARTATLMHSAVRLNRSRGIATPFIRRIALLVRDSHPSFQLEGGLFAEKVQKRFIESLRRFEMRQMADALENHDFRISHARRQRLREAAFCPIFSRSSGGA